MLLEGPGDWDNADHLAGLSVERAELAVAAARGSASMVIASRPNPCCSAVISRLDMPAVGICWCRAFGRLGDLPRHTGGNGAARRVAVSPSGS